MRPLIRISFVLFCFFAASLSSFAGSEKTSPVKQAFLNIRELDKLDSFLAARVSDLEVKKASELSEGETSASTGKICSCQILNLESSNYDHRYMVLLAEKRNDGSGTVFEVAKNRIRNEKKHLKLMFYDKVEVVAEMQGTGSCKSMFYKLRTANSNLRLYEILNADIN